MNAALRVGVLGATGRVGTLLLREIISKESLSLGAAITRSGSKHIGSDIGTHLGTGTLGLCFQPLAPNCFDHCDVVIDFSMPQGLEKALPFLGNTPLVSGTTGLADTTEAALQIYAHTAPLLTAANFSTGVNVLLALVAQAAKALDDYEIEIVETHHRYKKDAPSGTALVLGKVAAEARGHTLESVVCHGREGTSNTRKAETIGIHAVRMGQVVGEHTVSIANDTEILTLSHSAQQRSTFVDGALRAAQWLVNQSPGRYTMADMLGLS